MEDNLNFNFKGRRHQIYIYLEMEDDLNFKEIKDNLGNAGLANPSFS